MRLILFFLMLISFSGISHAQTLKNVQRVTSNNLFEFESFGYGLDYSGKTVIIGTYDIRWIGKSQWVGRDSIPGGRVYILEQNKEGVWIEKQMLTSPDKHYTDRFGEMGVAISGKYAIVSASHHENGLQESDKKVKKAGAAYIFERDNDGIWKFKQKLVAFDRNIKGQFGLSVEIEGDYAFVGATGNNTDNYGKNTLKKAGAVFVFKRDANGNWNKFQKLTASDRKIGAAFGFACSASEDYLAVGAYADDDFVNGREIDHAGAVYIYKKNAKGVWFESQKLVTNNRSTYASFGGAVCLKGKDLIVGASSEHSWSENGDSLKQTGAVYIYQLSKYGTWDFKQKITGYDPEPYDNFGIAVAIAGNRALVGASYDEVIVDGKSLPNAGSAQFLEKDENGKWKKTQRVVSHDPGAGQRYGHYLMLSDKFAGVAEHLDGVRPVNTVGKNKTGVVFFYGDFPTGESSTPPTYEFIDYVQPINEDTTLITETEEPIREIPADTIKENTENQTEEITGEAPKFMLSPNPTTGKFQLNVLNYDGGQYKLIIRTPLSREVLKKNFGTKVLDLDLSREQNGVYIITVSNKFGESKEPLVIKTSVPEDPRNGNNDRR